MLLIREVFHCKPGKVRPLVEKFLAMSKLSEKMGMGKMKVMTDLSAERYWTVVAEMETPSMEAFEKMMTESAGCTETPMATRLWCSLTEQAIQPAQQARRRGGGGGERRRRRAGASGAPLARAWR